MKSYTTKDFLEALFNPGESTCFSESGRGTFVDPVFSYCGSAQFFSVNPLVTDRRDANVAAFRTFLIECDRMPQVEQLDYVRTLGMPWTTCVDSGGRSVHFTLCLERPLDSEATYRQLAARIHRAVEKADHTTKNPSRFSRLGGAFRDNGKEQRILGIRGRISLDMLNAWLDRFPEAAAPTQVEEHTQVLENKHLSKQTLEFIFERKAPEGRNNALFKAACNFCRAGYSIGSAAAYLEQAFEFGGRDSDVSQSEFLTTIKSAFRRTEQDAK